MPPKPPRGVDPHVAAVLDEVKPYLATAGAIALLAAPAEVIVPITRRLRGRRGVTAGPGLISLAHALLGLGVVHALRRDPARLARLEERRATRWLLALPVYLALSPALASERAVVLRTRSPLWGELVHPVGWLQIVLGLVTLRRARRARRTGGPPA